MKSLRILLVITALLAPLVAWWASSATVASPSSVVENKDGADMIVSTSRLSAPLGAAGPTISYQGEFPLTVDAGDYDLTYLVLDFAPGAQIPLHYHGGPALVVGMEGMLTLRPENGPEHMLMQGDVVNEKAGVRHAMINTGKANARVIAVVLLPKGAQLTNVVATGVSTDPPPPGPTVAFQGDYPLTVAAGEYSLVNLVLDFSPGAEIPLHYHGGPAVLVGMDGTLTLRPEGGMEHTLGPGQVANEKAGVHHVMINTTSANARILAGVLLPKGAELTTVVTGQLTGMPATGSGDMRGVALTLVALALLGLTLGTLTLIIRSKIAEHG